MFLRVAVSCGDGDGGVAVNEIDFDPLLFFKMFPVDLLLNLCRDFLLTFVVVVFVLVVVVVEEDVVEDEIAAKDKDIFRTRTLRIRFNFNCYLCG